MAKMSVTPINTICVKRRIEKVKKEVNLSGNEIGMPKGQNISNSNWNSKSKHDFKSHNLWILMDFK